MTRQKVAAIILAAGGSSRLGRPKQLLDWFGKPFVKHMVDLSHQLKLDPVVVVTGAGYQEVEDVIKDEKVLIAHNEGWQNGQSSSMKVGCKAVENQQMDALIIFLCDQPQVPQELIEKMLQEAQNEEVDIVATSVLGKICPPTLFKSKCIEGIMSLQGDQGGRVLLNRYNTHKIEWQDDRLMQDTDTEEDYLKLISQYSI